MDNERHDDEVSSGFDFNPDVADSIAAGAAPELLPKSTPETPVNHTSESGEQGDIFDQLSQVVKAPKLTRFTPGPSGPSGPSEPFTRRRFAKPPVQLDFDANVADITPVGTNPDKPIDPDTVARFPIPEAVITTPLDQCPHCFWKFTDPFHVLGNVPPGLADQMIKKHPAGTRQIPDPLNPGKIEFVLDKDPNDPEMLKICGHCGYDTRVPCYYECGHCHGTTTFRPKIWDYVCHHCGYSSELKIVLTDAQYQLYTTKETPLVDQHGKKVYGPLRVLDSVVYNELKPEQVHIMLGAEWHRIPREALDAYRPDTPQYILFALSQSWLEAPDFDDLEIPLFEIWKLEKVAKHLHRFSWEDGFMVEEEPSLDKETTSGPT